MICGGKVAEQQKKKAAIGQRGEKEHAGQGQVSGKILVVDPDEKTKTPRLHSTAAATGRPNQKSICRRITWSRSSAAIPRWMAV